MTPVYCLLGRTAFAYDVHGSLTCEYCMGGSGCIDAQCGRGCLSVTISLEVSNDSSCQGVGEAFDEHHEGEPLVALELFHFLIVCHVRDVIRIEYVP